MHIVWLSNSTLRNIDRGTEGKECSQKYICKGKKKKKEYIFPSISEWLTKLWYIDTMKYTEFDKIGRPMCSDITESPRYIVKWKRSYKIICIMWTYLCQGKAEILKYMTECICLFNYTHKKMLWRYQTVKSVSPSLHQLVMRTLFSYSMSYTPHPMSQWVFTKCTVI